MDQRRVDPAGARRTLDHLIAMKSSADRVKDRLMVMEYKEISGLKEPGRD